jgi:hypothetical protein
MSESFNELGFQDDENYICLDKDGKAHQLIELIVNWEPAPNTKIEVTCNSR